MGLTDAFLRLLTLAVCIRADVLLPGPFAAALEVAETPANVSSEANIRVHVSIVAPSGTLLAREVGVNLHSISNFVQREHYPCAWGKSGDVGFSGDTAIDALLTAVQHNDIDVDGGWDCKTSDFIVTSIGGVSNAGNLTWIPLVNSKVLTQKVCGYELKPGDSVTWLYGNLTALVQKLTLLPRNGHLKNDMLATFSIENGAGAVITPGVAAFFGAHHGINHTHHSKSLVAAGGCLMNLCTSLEPNSKGSVVYAATTGCAKATISAYASGPGYTNSDCNEYEISI